MGDRDLIDALGLVTAASDGIHRALNVALDQGGQVDPRLVDIDRIEQHRRDFELGFDFVERASRGHPGNDLTDDDYVRLRRARFGHLPGRIPPGEMVEAVDPGAPRETREPAEPRREWA